MVPLTVDDLLPLEEYAGRRQEFFDAHRRYVDRYRRVRVGPRLTLVFENRQTLWYRVQEVVRVARLIETRELELELSLYNRLLPGRDLLQAALLIEIGDPTRLVEELAPWRTLSGEQLRLHIGARHYPVRLVTCRPEDRCVGTAHWVQLPLPAEGRALLGRMELAAHFAFEADHYSHRSASLSDELRQSLLDDLALSDRDGPRRAG